MIWAMACAGAAGWMALSAAPGLRRLAAPTSARRRRGGRMLLALAGLAAAVVIVAPAGRWRALVLAALLVSGFGWALARRARTTRARARTRAEVARGAWELAGEVAAGRLPLGALRVAAADVPVLLPGAGVAALGGDVAMCWRRQAAEPGHEGLLVLARAWEVSTRTGAPMAPALRGVAEQVRERRRLGDTVRGELAAPRATSRLLAGLPLAGLGLGFAFGGDPAQFLLDTLVGQTCLLLAITLAGVGLLWSEHLAERASDR